MIASSAPSAKINAYMARIDTLSQAVQEAEKCLDDSGPEGVSLFSKVCNQLDECNHILNSIVPTQLPESFKAEKKTHQSCMKKYEELHKDGHKLCSKHAAVIALLERCNNLNEAVATRVDKKQQKSASAKPIQADEEEDEDEVVVEDEGRVPMDIDDVELPEIGSDEDEGGGGEEEHDPDRLLVGPSLHAFIREATSNYAKYHTMVQALQREEVSAVYKNLFDATSDCLRVCKDKELVVHGYNVSKIERYMKPLSIIYERMAAAAAPTRASASTVARSKGLIECKDGSIVKIGNGKTKIECKDCQERKVDYAGGKCEDCFMEGLDERKGDLSDMETLFSEEAKEAKRVRLAEKRTNTALTPVEEAYQKFRGYIGKVNPTLMKLSGNKNLLEPLIRLFESAEELVPDHVRQQVIHGVGGGDDDDDEDAEAMELDDEEEEEEEEEEEASSSKPPSPVAEPSNIVALRIADRIVRIRQRVPIERSLNELHTWYEKGDEQSLQRADFALKDMEGLTELWYLKAVGGKAISTPFISETDAKDKVALLQEMAPNVEYEVYKKAI